MDDKKEKKAGGITHFCLKHLVALMVTALFLLVVIMVYSIGVWAHVEQEKQQIDVELSQLIAEREYYETIKRDLPNMKKEYLKSESELKALKNDLNDIGGQIRTVSEKLSAENKKHDSLVEENRKLNDLISKRDDIQNELSKAKQELTAVKTSVKSANDELAKANDSLAEVKKQNDSAVATYNDNQTKLKQQRAQNDKLINDRDLLKQETDTLTARKDVLTEEIAKLSDLDSPVKKLEDLIAKESTAYASIEKELSDITQKLNSSYSSVDKELASSIESIKNSVDSIKALTSRKDIFDSLERGTASLNQALESIRATQKRVNDELSKRDRGALLNDMNAKLQDTSGKVEQLSDSVASVQSNMMELMNRVLKEQQELKEKLDNQEKSKK
mgnify:FL=1